MLGLMKLPNDSPLTQAHLSMDKGQKTTSEAIQGPLSAQIQALPKTLSALVNTWAQVQSSQLLPPKQNQQVLSQLNLLQPSSTLPLEGSGISQKLNIEHIARTLPPATTINHTIQLSLIKLLSVQGPISVLSTQSAKPGEEVRITQLPSGQLTLTPKQSTTDVQAFRSQFLSTHTNVKLTPNIDSHQVTGLSTQDSNLKVPTPQLPLQILNSQKPISSANIQTAITSSGQNYEHTVHNILTALKTNNPQTSTQVYNAAINPAPHSIKQTMQQVEHNIEKWVATFKQQFAHSSTTQTNVSHQTTNGPIPTPETKPELLQALQSTHTQPLTKETKQTLNALLSNISHDQKMWLTQTQQTLVNTLTAKLLPKGDALIPNWSSQPLASPPIKTFNELSHWLDVLIKPKTFLEQAAPSIKSGVSAQSQLHQTFQLLAASFGHTDNTDASENTLIRQLLNISQNLMKTTHDQILNRGSIIQPESQNLQFSIPYMHQNQMEWCEFEYRSQAQQLDNKTQGQSWHLILRFAQESTENFAIESAMLQEVLTITLWANTSDQLKRLHSEIPLLRDKLTEAGFKIDNITSKHGSPSKLAKPIQQSLIDIHT